MHKIYDVEFSTYLNQRPNSSNRSKVTVHLGLKIAPASWPVHSFLPGFSLLLFLAKIIYIHEQVFPNSSSCRSNCQVSYFMILRSHCHKQGACRNESSSLGFKL